MATGTKRKTTTQSRKTSPQQTSTQGDKRAASSQRVAAKTSQNNSGKNRYFIAILIATTAILTMIAIISYFYTWRADQSIDSLSQIADINAYKATNSSGKLGAVVGKFFVERLFGIMAVIAPFIIALPLMLIFRVKGYIIRKTLLSLTSIMLIGSVAVSYLFPYEVGSFGSSLGGEWGHRVSLWCVNLLGDMGSGIVIFMLLALWLVYTSLTVTKYLGKFISHTITSIAKFLGSIFSLFERLLIVKPKKQPSQSHLAAIPKQEEQRVNENYYNIEGVELPDDQTITEEQKESSPASEDTTDIVDATSESPKEFWNNHNPLTVITNEEGRESVIPTVVTANSTNTATKQEDYSQAIDRKNMVMFNFGVTPSQEEQQQDDMLMMDLKEVDPTTPTAATTATAATTVATESNSSDNFIITNRPESGSGDDIELKIVDSAKEDKEQVEDSSFEISGGYTSSSDIKEDAFEVAITSNAELNGDSVGTTDNIIVTTNMTEEIDNIETSIFDPTLELSHYKLPPIDLLDNRVNKVVVTEEELVENKNRIVKTLDDFNISIDKIKATIGPTVTLYEIKPSAGVRISKIKNLEDDIALSLSALGIRIIAPIPGKGTIGIEVPNKSKEIVSMYSVVKSAKFNDTKYDLPIVLGRTIQNDEFVIDLAKMPHILVAGATGQGKSVGLNAIVTSLLYKKHPSELKLIMVDPKRVELTLYQNIENHFLAKMEDEEEAIITDTQRVVYTLNSLCIEMDNRYKLLNKARARNIKEYNEKFKHRNLNPNKGHRFLPYFVVIIDEFADLIMTAGREIETPIARIAQLARAVGIHLVIATQRPTTNIITGVIKANFPARIAFKVSSMIDSRTILDQPGANQLIGQGDMLVSTGNDTTRVQCAFIDTPEVERITDYIGAQQSFGSPYLLPEYTPEGESKATGFNSSNGKLDDKFTEVARYVVQNQQGSASTIQRNFSIGFNRAGRLMDQLEKAGIVGRQEGSKPRQVLVSDIGSLELILHDIENRND